jgi:hypothetical protein
VSLTLQNRHRRHKASTKVHGDVHGDPSRFMRLGKGLQTWLSFFNDRYAAARPMTAPFFFEGEQPG